MPEARVPEGGRDPTVGLGPDGGLPRLSRYRLAAHSDYQTRGVTFPYVAAPHPRRQTYKRVNQAAVIVWRVLMAAEGRFKRLNEAALLPGVYAEPLKVNLHGDHEQVLEEVTAWLNYTPIALISVIGQQVNQKLTMVVNDMRILQVINRLGYGGAESLVTQWAKQFHFKGHQVDVCTIYSMGEFGLELERQGIPVYKLDLDPRMETHHLRRKYDLRVSLPLARIIKKGRYDAVHAHLFPTSLFVAIASYLASEPGYFFSEHSITNRRRRYPIFKVLDWAIYRRFNQIIAVSNTVRDSLLLWLPGLSDKVRVVHNSIDPKHYNVPNSQVLTLRRQLGIIENSLIILYVGRLLPAKGPDILLEALSLLPADVRPFRVLIVGEGPLEEALRERAAESRLEGKVDFLGSRGDIAHLLDLADLVVLPSRWEGLPMILLEAMAARRPVIATRVGGIPEVIKNGENGWLVDPEDAQALATTISIALESPNLRGRFGDRGHETVCSEYSMDNAIQRLLEIYSMQAPLSGQREA